MTDAADQHERFALDDAAYVLGALEEADRVAYEEHLRDCRRCRDAVAELTELPPLLAQLDAAGLAATASEEPPPQTLLPKLLAEVRRQRGRRSLRTAAVGFAAACLIGLLALGGVELWSDTHQPQKLVMQAVGANPGGVHATIRLLGGSSGTRIQLDCGYHGGAPAGTGYPAAAPSGPASASPPYRMLVYNRAGAMRDLGSWTPQPGEDVELTRDSPWSRQALSRIEITDGDGTVLLSLGLR